MMRASEFVSRFTSGVEYEWSYVLEETRELVEEIRRCNVDGIIDEFGDVAIAFQMCVHWRIGGDFRVVAPERNFRKYAKRMGRWRGIFLREGLTFSPKYLRFGGNPDRPCKRARILGEARAEQG